MVFSSCATLVQAWAFLKVTAGILLWNQWCKTKPQNVWKENLTDVISQRKKFSWNTQENFFLRSGLCVTMWAVKLFFTCFTLIFYIQYASSLTLTHDFPLSCLSVSYIWPMQAAVVQSPGQPLLLQNQEGAASWWDGVCSRKSKFVYYIWWCMAKIMWTQKKSAWTQRWWTC